MATDNCETTLVDLTSELCCETPLLAIIAGGLARRLGTQMVWAWKARIVVAVSLLESSAELPAVRLSLSIAGYAGFGWRPFVRNSRPLRGADPGRMYL